MARPFDVLFPEVKREESIASGVCPLPPLGCGQPITGFTDALSARESEISGLCQTCQDELFGVSG